MWDRLKDRQAAVKDRKIIDLFDEERPEAFGIESDGLFFDFSKTNIDPETYGDLIALAERQGVPAKRDAMFAGEKINETEERAVLHTALRLSLIHI